MVVCYFCLNNGVTDAVRAMTIRGGETKKAPPVKWWRQYYIIECLGESEVC